MPTMLRIKELMAGTSPASNLRTLELLNGLHKIAVIYIWMSFR